MKPDTSDVAIAGLDTLLKEVAKTPDAPDTARFRGTDRFVLGRRLGQGTFGVVYEAEDKKIGRNVALKLLKHAAPREIARLKHEFRSIAEVVHPNLVPLHELIATEDHWFFTMDLIRGRSFLDYTRKHAGPAGWNPVDEARLRSALRQIAQGVSAVHRAGKLHRDLKPANVMVSDDGTVTILDFGLASDIVPDDGAALRSQTSAGTPAYMAPEQAAEGGLTPACDWFALGVMLFEAMTGKLPFQAQSLAGLVEAKSVDGPSPSSVDSGVPADLDTLCAELLRRDPVRRAGMTEILELVGEAEPIRSSDAPHAPNVPVSVADFAPLFVGRAAALSELSRAFEVACTEGGPVSVTVHGQPGIGKTSLCRRFLRDVREREDALVLEGRCYERESVPFKTLDGVIDALALYLRNLPRAEAAALMPRDVHLLAQLWPALRRVPALDDVPQRSVRSGDHPTLRRRAARELKEMLARLADKRRLVVFVDDIQWGDLDSARVLSEVLGPPDPPELMWIAAFRDEGVQVSLTREIVASFPGTGSAQRQFDIELEPLQGTEAERLAGEILQSQASGRGSEQTEGRRIADLARTIAADSAGHPLFLFELAKAAEAPESTPPREQKTGSLMKMIWARLQQLTNEARDFMETIAVAGGPLPVGLCFEASGVGRITPELLASLRALHLVRTSGPELDDRVEVYHDRIRESVLVHISDARRNSRHLDLAATIERSQNPDPEALAMHFFAGGYRSKAATFATVAGDQAMQALAFERAVALFERALACTDPSTPAAQALRVKLAKALVDAGRAPEAGRTSLAASKGATGVEALRLRMHAAAQLLASGNCAEGLKIARPLLEELGIKYPTTQAAAKRNFILGAIRYATFKPRFTERSEDEIPPIELLRIDACGALGRGHECFDTPRALSLFTTALRLALKAGDRRRIAASMAPLGTIIGVGLGAKPAHALLDRAENLARESDDQTALAAVLRFRGSTSGFVEADWAGATRAFEAAHALTDEIPGDVLSDIRFGNKINPYCLARAGRLRELFAQCEAYWREAVDRGDLMFQDTLTVSYQVVRWFALDKPHKVRAILDAGPRVPGADSVDLYYALAEADWYYYTGESGGAKAFWDKTWPELESRGIFEPATFLTEAVRSRALAVVTGGGGEREARPLLRKLRRIKTPFAEATRRSVRAMASYSRGDLEAARELLAEAATSYEEAKMKLDAAACRRLQGQLMLGDEGEALIGDADAVFAREGVAAPAKWGRMVLCQPAA